MKGGKGKREKNLVFTYHADFSKKNARQQPFSKRISEKTSRRKTAIPHFQAQYTRHWIPDQYNHFLQLRSNQEQTPVWVHGHL